MKRSTPALPPIPDKIYFRIGEVSTLVGVDTHVLRYWESEFAMIRPFRDKSKQRLYRRQDIEHLLQIKELLHNQGYTISGARRYLKSLGSIPRGAEQAHPVSRARDPQPLLQKIKTELEAILAQLDPGKNKGL